MRLQRGVRQADERFTHDVREGHGVLGGDAMCRVHYDEEPILSDQMRLQGLQISDVRDDAQIGASFRDGQHDLRAWALIQVDREIRVGRQKAAELFRHERSQGRCIRQQGDTSLEARRVGPQFAAHLFNLTEDQASMTDQGLAGGSSAYAALRAFQQRRPQCGLHTRDSLARRCRCEMHRLRSPCQATVFHRHQEQSHIDQIKARGGHLRFWRKLASEIPDCIGEVRVDMIGCMTHFILIVSAGLLAGAMNALAGGGSFVSLPAMIAAGVPSVQANASSTVALYPGGIASAWAYRDGLGPVGTVSFRQLLVITLVGGIVGAVVLLRTPAKTFDFVLPWLLLLATLALGFGQRMGEWLRRRWQIKGWVVLTVQFGLGIYGGYFGGAVGIMMMALWGLLDGRDLKRLSAPRTLLVSAANTMAVLTFIIVHAVRWPETVVMLIAATLGGYGGAQLGRRAPVGVIRMGTLLATGCITIVFFVRAYQIGGGVS
jgi:uncharacterized protein